MISRIPFNLDLDSPLECEYFHFIFVGLLFFIRTLAKQYSKYCHSHLSLRIHLATPASTGSTFVVHECHQDACPSVHFMSPGLLQLTAVWHQRWTTMSPPVVQNAAARLVRGARRRDHITSLLRQLQRVVFKIAGLVHQSLVGAAPVYLADDCRLFWTLLVAHCGQIPMTCGSCSCREHIINLAIGACQVVGRRSLTVEQPSTFHPDYGDWDCPSTPLDNL